MLCQNISADILLHPSTLVTSRFSKSAGDVLEVCNRSYYRWLFGPLAIYRFFPHSKIVFATTWLDYLKSRCICSLPLEDIINLVASRSDCIVVL
jgi:hypothetical protein